MDKETLLKNRIAAQFLEKAEQVELFHTFSQNDKGNKEFYTPTPKFVYTNKAPFRK